MKLGSELVYDGKGRRLFGLIDGKFSVVDVSEKPYCFATKESVEWAKENGGSVVFEKDLRGLNGERVFRVMVDEPSQIPKAREAVKEKGGKVFESDVPWLRRLLTDYVFEIEYGKVAYLDVEVDDSDLKKVTKYGDVKILCIGVGLDGKNEWFYGSEKEMLQSFTDWMKENKVAVFAGWNVVFDIKHIVERGKKLGIDRRMLDAIYGIDLLEDYKQVVKGLSDYKLENVASVEGLGEKKRDKKVCEMRKDELRDYNLNDVELVRAIDNEYGFTRIWLELAKVANLCLSMLTPVQLVDTLILRRARKLGYVLPDREWKEKKGYEGAYVKQPVAGVYKMVAEYDFESLYPNIIVHENIDVDGFYGALIPTIASEFLKLRKEYKELFKKTGDVKYDVMQTVYKILANSVYGVFGQQGFRFFDERKAGMVTAKARELIMKLIEFVKGLGLEVLYADTDSCFVKLNGMDAEKLEGMMNDYLKPYRLKFERLYDVLIFLDVKKRYWGWTVDGQEVVKGFEVRRSDWFELMKEVQRNVVEMIKDNRSKDDIVKYLNEVRKKMKNGELDDKLVICKSVKGDIGDYKVDAPHVRAYRKALERGFDFADGRVRYVWVNGDVEPVLDLNGLRGKLDYEYYWRLIRHGVLKRIIDSVYARQNRLEVVEDD